MTYNFFNAGRLAFGKKITSVFNSLNRLLEGANEHIDEISTTMKYYQQFMGKNYLCPVPTRLEMPVRTNEIFALFEGYAFIKNASTDGTTTTFEITVLNPVSSRITVATGSTNLTSGFAFVKPSVSLENFNRTIRFSETNDPQGEEIFICQFMIDGTDILIIDPNSSDLGLSIGEEANYRSLSLEYVGYGSYTCTKRSECILALDTKSWTDCDIKLNNADMLHVDSLTNSHQYMIFYLKEGDVVSGDTVGEIYRVNYNK